MPWPIQSLLTASQGKLLGKKLKEIQNNIIFSGGGGEVGGGVSENDFWASTPFTANCPKDKLENWFPLHPALLWNVKLGRGHTFFVVYSKFPD